MSTMPSASLYGYSPPPPGGSDRLAASAIAWLTDRLATRIARAARVRRDMRRLAAMDDRALSDIGLHRSQIERAVNAGRQ